MNKKVKLIIFFISSLAANITYGSNNEFINHILSFDAAQSQLNLQKSLPHLADEISIKIKTCSNTVDTFNKEEFIKTYSSILKNAELLSISRNIKKIENCISSQCTIYSDLTERLVGYQGKYDKTVTSADVTRIEKINGEIKIVSIDAEIQCK